VSDKTGTVSKYLAERGFGWIRPDEDEPEIFFHKNSTRSIRSEDLIPGLSVLYVSAMSDKNRPYARVIRIRPVSKETSLEAPNEVSTV
jgi:cold shock CspA family protein